MAVFGTGNQSYPKQNCGRPGCFDVEDDTHMTSRISSDRVDLMLRAFSNLTRLRILHLLQRGERPMDDICKILQINSTQVFRQLAYLRKAGLVVSRRCGPRGFFRLTPAESAFQEKLFACLASCFSDLPEIQQDVAGSGGPVAAAQASPLGCCEFTVSPGTCLRPREANGRIRCGGMGCLVDFSRLAE